MTIEDIRTQGRARTDPLFTPLEIGSLTLRNRVMSTSHASGLEENGMPALRYQRYHEEKAKGGMALTMFGGSSNVAPDSPNIFHQLNVGSDEIIPYLREFSERIHARGAALMCQITHLGRRGDPYADNWLPTIGPSPLRETLHRSFPREMDEHDIARVVKAYGAAAKRCYEGGIDGIETLSAGHLIGQFFSPITNHRTDRFGGTLENRCRFAIMVHDEIRRHVGPDFLIGMRFVIDEADENGLSADDCIQLALMLKDSGGVDFFNAIYGKMDTERALAQENMPGMGTPLAPWVKPVGAFRREIGLPVFHAARIADVASARYAIQEGLLDMAGMTRAHIADPYIVEKLKGGREDQIRPCVGATHCMTGFRPTCLHNAATGRETTQPHIVAPTLGPKRKVVVVGGGPAGLEAARVAAARGHSVVLFEAAPKLGGQVLLASRHTWRRDLIGIIDWRVAELERYGVEVRANTYAEEGDILAEAPDVVVVATGGMPDLGWLPGNELCTSAWDILSGTEALRESVVVYDGTGRHAAPMCAEFALERGTVTRFFSLDSGLGAELTYSERVTWKSKLYTHDLDMRFDERLVSVIPDGNRLKARFVNETNQRARDLVTDQVIVEHGTYPLDEVFHDIKPHSVNDGVTDIDSLIAGEPQPWFENGGLQVHRIGDAAASRNIAAAIFDGLRLCKSI